MGSAAVLGERQVRGMFFQRLEETSEASWVSSISHMFTSDQQVETYRFLGNVPALRAWRGSRRKTEPQNFEITIRNDKYEGALEFARDDLRREKTDQIRARIGDLASRAAILPQKVITDLITDNNNAYDGIAFFGDHSSSRGSQVDNEVSSAIAGSEPTASEMKDAILLAVETIMGATDDTGEPMNEFARQFQVMVPTNIWHATVAALQDQFVAASVSNTLVSVQQGGLMINAVMNPRLTNIASTGSFYVFRTDADIKPFIWQDEVRADLQVLGSGSDHEFWNDSHVFGALRQGAGGLGAYEMACKIDLT